jgi:hypothetical protein
MLDWHSVLTLHVLLFRGCVLIGGSFANAFNNSPCSWSPVSLFLPTWVCPTPRQTLLSIEAAPSPAIKGMRQRGQCGWVYRNVVQVPVVESADVSGERRWCRPRSEVTSLQLTDIRVRRCQSQNAFDMCQEILWTFWLPVRESVRFGFFRRHLRAAPSRVFHSLKCLQAVLFLFPSIFAQFSLFWSICRLM